MKVIIVIPIYSPILADSEKASLIQCIKVLNKYDISFVTFKNLDIKIYQEIVSQNRFAKIHYEYFDQSNFGSIGEYNKFCLTPEFYMRFREYDYMLIYQLDAWVFNDNLLEWCKKGYDYIGAPIFDDWSSTIPKMIGIGNGGFSLRRISYFIDLLTSKRKFYSFKQLWKSSSCVGNYLSIPHKVLFKIHNTSSYYIKQKYEQGFNEDIIISFLLKESQYVPKIPSTQIGMKFAFEKYPSLLYQINQQQLPFGCHAFCKYEFETFWSKFITL